MVISKLLKWIFKGVISCLPIFPFKGQRACFWPKLSFVKSLIRMTLFFHAFILVWLKIQLFLHLLFFSLLLACAVKVPIHNSDNTISCWGSSIWIPRDSRSPDTVFKCQWNSGILSFRPTIVQPTTSPLLPLPASVSIRHQLALFHHHKHLDSKGSYPICSLYMGPYLWFFFFFTFVYFFILVGTVHTIYCTRYS